MRRSFVPKISVAILAAGIFTFAIQAQSPEKTPTTDPSKKPIKAKVEPNNAFKRWLVDDAGPIITDAEKRAYLALTTDEERENFIEDFWHRRDPTPDTEENEYREAYYERISYANEHFSSGMPGSKTDRGLIYIRWGKPDDIESHPSGGAYDKASYEGGGSATTYPFERWFYRHLDGVGDGIEIEFVDQTGSGEYRFARDLNDKILTLGPPQQTNANASYLREQDMPFNVIDRYKNLNAAPTIKYSDFPDDATKVDGPVLGMDPIGVDMQIGFFRQSDDRVITTFTIQTSNNDLTFEPIGGLETATLNLIGRLRSVAGRPVGSFEESMTTSSTREELTSVKNRKSIYQRVLPMAPGTYRADVMVRDVRTGNIGVVKMGFKVPKYDSRKLSTSSLVLATTLRPTTEIGSRFVVGNMKLIPNLSGVYKQGQQVGVYMQIYNAGTDETTLRPSVDVEYVVLKDGKQVSSTTEDWNGLSDSSQRLTLSRLLPTEGLKPGDYEVKIVAKDHVGEQQVENMSRFTIAK